MPKNFFASPIGIIALVLCLLGLSALVAGTVLYTVAPSFAGSPIFLLIGGMDLVAGFALGGLRMAQLNKRLRLLSEGGICQGTIISVDIDRSTRVNRQNPCRIRYRYQVAGEQFEASVSVFANNHGLESGSTVEVAYDRQSPKTSALKKFLV